MKNQILLFCAVAMILASPASMAGEKMRQVTGEQFMCVVNDNAGLGDTTRPVKAKRVMTFVVKNINSPKAEPVCAFTNPNTDEPARIAVTPRESRLEAFMDDWTFGIKGGKMIFTGDSAGINYTTLVLFEDSGYTRGYVTLERQQDQKRGYSTVTCGRRTVTVNAATNCY